MLGATIHALIAPNHSTIVTAMKVTAMKTAATVITTTAPMARRLHF